MPTTDQLGHAVAGALALASAQPGVREVEAFASANRVSLCRLNYTSHIPCNGVEEPKSSESYGLGLHVVLDTPDGPVVGFGSEPGDLGERGATRALDKARRAAVRDPGFLCFPHPGPERPALQPYHDPSLFGLSDGRLVETGWTVLAGALRAMLSSGRLADLAGSHEELRRLGLIVGGDVTVLEERVAVASSHMPVPRTDESSRLMAAATVMIETLEAKGSGWSVGTQLDGFTDEAGADAAERAVAAVGGEQVPSGEYTVIFGPQPVTDLMNNLLLPACHASAFFASATPFMGQLDRAVAAPGLSVYDDGARPGVPGSRRITCEGLPTGRTDLIRDGRLVGLLSNWYESQRLLRDPQLRDKLGAAGDRAAAALAARNGFRYAPGGGRAFDTPPGISATNVFVEGATSTGLPDLLRHVGDGLYVGRIWYTYPVNGLRAADFTCTVVADSFIIRDGRRGRPIRANAIRINDNLLRLLANIVGVTAETRATVVWGADEVVHAPDIAVSGVRVDAMTHYTEVAG